MIAFPLSLRTKVALAMAAVAALVVTAILATNFHIRRAQLLQEFQSFVRGAAYHQSSYAEAVPGR